MVLLRTCVCIGVGVSMLFPPFAQAHLPSESIPSIGVGLMCLWAVASSLLAGSVPDGPYLWLLVWIVTMTAAAVASFRGQHATASSLAMISIGCVGLALQRTGDTPGVGIWASIAANLCVVLSGVVLGDDGTQRVQTVAYSVDADNARERR